MPGRRTSAASPVGDDELGEIALRIPALFHAAKALGGPPEEVRRLIGASGLGPRHLNALRHLMIGGRMSVSALGARLGVALPTASLMVSELSRAGLLERVEDDTDRRRVLVRVAPERAALIEAFLSRRLEPLRRAMDRLSVADRAAFLRGLDLLTAELTAANGAGTAAPCPALEVEQLPLADPA